MKIFTFSKFHPRFHYLLIVFSFHSICNLAEVDMVVKYINVLLTTNICRNEISDHDIGIVTPYKMQAKEISNKCEITFQNKTNNITIGTAAILQGQEKQIMIISTVSAGHLSDFAADVRVLLHS